MKFDDIFKEIGEFGPYQRRNYLLLVVGWVLTGPIMVLSVFVMGSPDHRLESYPRHIHCYYRDELFTIKQRFTSLLEFEFA